MNLEELNSLFLNNQFFLVKEVIDKLLESVDDELSDISVDHLNLLFQSEKKLGLTNNKSSVLIIKKYFQTKNYLSVVKFYEQTQFVLDNITLEYVANSYFEIGEVELSKRIFLTVCENYLKEKNFPRLEQLISYVTKIHHKNIFNKYVLFVLNCKGDVLGLTKILEDRKNYDLVIEELLLSKHLKDYLQKSEIRQLKIDHKDCSNEEFFKLSLANILENPFNKETLISTLKKAVTLRRKELVELLSLIITHDSFTPEVSDEEVSMIKEIELASLDFDDFEYIEDIDLGTDLFFSENLSEVDELENKARFLIQMGEVNKAKTLITKLREVNPDHTLVKEVEELNYKSEATKFLNSDNTLKAYEDLEELIKEEENSELDRLKLVIKKNIDSMSGEELNKNYKEIAVSLIMMNLSEMVLHLINLLDESEDTNEIIERENLLISAYLNEKEYLKALSRAENCLDSYPFKEEERINFYYIIAECYRGLGRKIDAIKYYARVKALNKNYRMVQLRINEI